MEECVEKYPYSKFTKEDRRMYEEILESLPYDSALESFFIEEAKSARRQEQMKKRYLIPLCSNEVEFKFPVNPSAEDHFLSGEKCRKIQSLIAELTPTQGRRIIKMFYENQTRRQIADSEGVSEAAVGKTIAKVLRILRESLQGEQV